MRLQLALNVADLDESISFYTKMFGTEPLKVRPGYANFAIEQPPLKLGAVRRAGEPGSINHSGVETETKEEVRGRSTHVGRGPGHHRCRRHAVLLCGEDRDVDRRADNRWEWYVKNADAEQFANVVVAEVRSCGTAQHML